MGFNCKMMLDSLAPCGKRLSTLCLTYPRFIHSEVLTHRDRARNSASSRAIPWPKMMAAVTEEPVVPIRWGSEQKGMQTGCEVEDVAGAERAWLEAHDNAVESAKKLAELGVHKSLCNRLVEPWMWITVVMTSTEWNNFFRLRCHHDAEIHFQQIAGMIRNCLDRSAPEEKDAGEWHLPYVTGNDLDQLKSDGFNAEQVRMISVARMARVSYLTHEGKRDPSKDLELFGRLVQGSGFGHWSCHEHVAQACSTLERSGPFVGWRQYRKSFSNENLEG